MSKLSHSLLLSSMALAISSAYGANPGVDPATDPATDAADRDRDVQQVVVTAQKRAQTTLDVAQAISVVSGETLEREQASAFADYLKLVPSLQLVQSTPGEGRLVMRGLDTGGVASTVAVYLDETPFGSSSGLVNGAILAGDFDTFDMARVEVLRGPQGALYGASSLGGLLKFVTNGPETDRFLMRVRAGAATVDGGKMAYRSNVVVNTPISDTLAFRASGSYTREPGFIDSIGTAGSDVARNLNGARNAGGRAALQYTPNADFSLRLSAVAQNIAVDSAGTVESDPVTLATLYGRQTQSQYVPQKHNVKYRVYNATVNWNLAWANLTSSTSSSTQKQVFRDDATYNLSALVEGAFGTPNDLFLAQNTELKKFTQELRLSSNAGSNAGGMLDWLAGVYYTDEDGDLRQRYVALQPGTLTPLAGLPELADIRLQSKYREYAAFANTTLHFGSRYDLDLGARYSHNKQHAVQGQDGALVGGADSNAADSAEHVFTYAVAPKWKIDERNSLYLRAAKGFRPGGPNVLPPNPPAGTPTTYASDSVMSYEAGFKSISRDGRLSFDVAAFHIDWKDIQLLAVVNGFGVNTNGVGATSDGLEFNVTYRPMSGLRLSANGAWTDATLDGDTSPLVGGMKDDRLPFSPKVSVGVSADYRWSLGAATPAFAGVSVRHLSKQFGAFDADYRAAFGRQREIGSYHVVDAHFGVDIGAWTLEAYGKNLTDSEGKTSTSAATANGGDIYPGGAIATGVIAPRTVGLTLTREF
ncbi:outer membrane receptor protein involved in Fe transport [Pseudoduganella lurida]|uniref:Outer membrane receptor protein involved in Fe transport n=1 Tax=Pseudoduganella lurida TaxID=1036180 RepID=A0A562RL97_9BURK|nr:TonB-dependent receptor [Pseudoduganella lurida]TWI69216.1 outer membrane receptor protein involved in Fe transport [Pseudoduganella lurida]